MSRTTRIEETRAATSRDALEDFTPMGATPKDLTLGPDVVLRWVRKYVNGVELDNRSFFTRLQFGWVPVNPQELPHLKQLTDQDGNIQWAGCILCKISAHKAAQARLYAERKATGALASAKSEFAGSGDRRAYKSVESNSSLRGSRPTE